MKQRWNPFAELDAIRREIERTLGEGNGGRKPFSRFSFLPGVAARQYPLINISDRQDAVEVRALAPGIDPNSLDVNVVHGTLTISGEKRAAAGNIRPDAYHRNERAAGRFVRTIDLPVEVDPEKVSADYQNGLLTVVLPKAETHKPRKISVNVQ